MASFEMMMEVDDLLHSGDKEDARKALALLKKRNAKVQKNPSLLGYLAKAQLLSGDAKAALASAEKAIAMDTLGRAWGHFWRAASLAVLDQDRKEIFASLSTAYSRDEDVAAEALRQPAFETLRDEPAFLKAIKRQPARSLDTKLSRLLKLALADEPFKLYQAASKLVDTHEDLASVLDALVDSLTGIVDDLDEHGDANLDDYGRRKISPDTFRAELREAKAQRKALGRKKSAFQVMLERAR
ncbi:hypothetical protein P2318_24125 [Myxococcaceae bacterium GXIMD 01537]